MTNLEIQNQDRFTRQNDLIPRDRLSQLTATVIGVGAIGRQVALQLAAIGVPNLQLVDFDIVDFTNVTTQGYSAADIGQFKVHATGAALQSLDASLKVDRVQDRFRGKLSCGVAVFCCVDTIAARAAIWRSVQNRCRFWVDGRMLGEVIRVLAVTGANDFEPYASTLFAAADGRVKTPCNGASRIDLFLPELYQVAFGTFTDYSPSSTTSISVLREQRCLTAGSRTQPSASRTQHRSQCRWCRSLAMTTTLRTAITNYLHAGSLAQGTKADYQTTLNKWKLWGNGVPLEKLGRTAISKRQFCHVLPRLATCR